MKRLSQLTILALALTSAPVHIVSAQSQSSATGDDRVSSVGTMPNRGMTMERVERAFGQPRQRLAPVGDPPITRWVYDGFTVYFEHHIVITSVATADSF